MRNALQSFLVFTKEGLSVARECVLQETAPNAERSSLKKIPTINLNVLNADGMNNKLHKQWAGNLWRHYETKQPGLACASDCEACEKPPIVTPMPTVSRPIDPKPVAKPPSPIIKKRKGLKRRG